MRGADAPSAEAASMEGREPRLEASRLIAARRWCALATVDRNAAPFVSYVPFACVDGAFGIVVSRLSAHTAHLFASPSASVLFVDDEPAQPDDAYARARLSTSVTARAHEPGSAKSDAVWTALEARQGSTVRTLRTLPDFHAISLEPVSGRLVLGFASAHRLDAAALAEILHRFR